MDLKQPTALRLSGNVAENFKQFKQQFEIYWDATSHLERSEKQKLSLFLHVAGAEAIEVYNSFTFTAPEVRNFENVLRKFEEYSIPKVNETYQRYIFRNRMQKEGENIEQFVVDLKLKAQSCNFGTILNSLIRDQIVVGVTDKKMRERMLREDDLTLEKAVRICQAIEQTNIQLCSLESNNRSSESVNLINKNKNGSKVSQKRNQQYGKQRYSETDSSVKGFKCSRCNTKHGYKQCPAYKKQCKKCSLMNHFAICCKTPKNSKSKVHAVDDNCVNNENDFTISSVDEIFVDKKQWFIKADIDDINVVFKIDTGSQVNLLPYEYYVKIKNKYEMKKNVPILKAYSGSKIKTYGTISVQMKVKNEEIKCSLIIVENGRQPILGLETSEKLGIVKFVNNVNKELNRENILHDYKKLFTGLGCIKQKHKIHIKEDSVPVIQPSRRIPLALRDRLKLELDRMESSCIIEKVDEPSDWVSSLVIVEKKNGSLRICLDPKNLNDVILREHYSIPTRNEIEADLAGAKIFTKLDANSGFYQIPLDKSSSKLCTFNTPFGRYRFLRVPFGIKSATEIYHKIATQVYEGLEGVKVYIDDVLVYGKNKQEHDERLRQVLERTLEAGLTFNKDKCEFGKTEILFMGDKLTQNGMTINSENLEAILKLPTPKTKLEVQRILGMVNYVGKYIPNLAEKTKHLRNLIKKDTVMEWNCEHKKELDVLKRILTQNPVLCYFDPQKDTKISSDASQSGLGSVLLQKHDEVWKPVAYASRSLTECESRWSQIEKEALGLVYGCEKFNDFVYGREIILETDHKPLITLSKKCLADIPMRLQRLFIRLLKYHFDMIYVSGKKLVIADTLSRAFLQGSEKTEIENLVQVHVDSIMRTLNITDEMLNRFREETAKDIQLRILKDQIYEGWQDKHAASAYQAHKDDLTVVNGLIMKGNRIVVPKSLKSDMLERIHEGHLGIEKCKRRARQILFWPLMNSDIEAKVKRCNTCQKYQYKQQKEPLIQRSSDIPWDCVGTDIYYFARKHYLIVYDSNYPEVEEINDLAAVTTIQALKKIFARHGIPREVYSDNGTHYDNREFKEFSKKYEFKFTTSSPKYPRSNGLSEKGVQVVKRLLKKAKDDGTDWELGLMNYRNAPLENGKSPAELLMGRSLRTRLPLYSLKNTSHKKKYPSSWRGKLLKPLQPGDLVRIQDGDEWKIKAKVLREVAPRSYEVLTESDRVLRRNRQHLLKVEGDYRLMPEEEITPMTHQQYLPESEMMNNPKKHFQQDAQQPEIEEGEKDIVERDEPVINNAPGIIQPQPKQVNVPVLRRSSRIRKPPNRMNYKLKKKKLF